ncbi:MAG: DNA topoisomerase IV subunit A [Spirochaetales bacterium]|nr:DNA topoisomerase IV subunit A [Spirochaetales bacterium]
MAYVKDLYNKNFLEYASYVIKERAIPDILDGLKPVQRRILHSLFEMDDGRFHKVANVVGHCMKYHPHGDSSIYEALVNLANKEFFIDRQGNFGNIFTGDPASAARYIECRILQFSKDILFSPEITEYVESYDGRNLEPVVFPSKLPLAIIHGVEGIAVGMATKILPHNINEVIEAMKLALHGKKTLIYPDFFTGGDIDVSGYDDGKGRILVRSKFDISSDDKRIFIREIPYGMTTESLINSIDNAAKKGKLKISKISDYSTDKVEIELRISRGVAASEVVAALYAYTDCEYSISVNPLLISNGVPVCLSISDIIANHAGVLKDVLTRELEFKKKKLEEKLHIRTLEQIFIEEKIYKSIEKMKTKQAIVDAVYAGFVPFKAELYREITDEDVEHLLKIPIRRISLFDINKFREEIAAIKKEIELIIYNLAHIVEYATSFLDGIVERYTASYKRVSKIAEFTQVDVREVVERDIDLLYDSTTGFLGKSVASGKALFKVSPFDKVLVVTADGKYRVIEAPEKQYFEAKLVFCGYVDEDLMEKRVFTAVYKSAKEGYPYIKKFKIEKFITAKEYDYLKEGETLLGFTLSENVDIQVFYKKKPRLKVLEESFASKDYLIKGVKASGVRLSSKEVNRAKIVKASKK